MHCAGSLNPSIRAFLLKSPKLSVTACTHEARGAIVIALTWRFVVPNGRAQIPRIVVVAAPREGSLVFDHDAIFFKTDLLIMVLLACLIWAIMLPTL